MTQTATAPQPREGEIRTSVHGFSRGQRRAYADIVTEGVVKVERYSHGQWQPDDDISDEEFKEKYSRKLANWVEKGHWSQPKLSSITRLGNGCWRVVVTEEYPD